MVRVVIMLSVVGSAAFVACGYGASFGDCTISCASLSDCPSGFTCVGTLCMRGANTMCSPFDGGAMDAEPADSLTSQDAEPDTILSENINDLDVTVAAFSCTTCPGNVVSSGLGQDLSWYREFWLHDFSGVTGGFQINKIRVGCSLAMNASITVKVYSYTGTLFASTIDTSAGSLIQIASAGPTQVQTCNNDVVVPITATIPADGAFVVEIDEDDQFSDDNGMCGFTKEFRLGANGSGESEGSYYKASCAGGSAASTPAIWMSNDVILTVEGTAD